MRTALTRLGGSKEVQLPVIGGLAVWLPPRRARNDNLCVAVSSFSLIASGSIGLATLAQALGEIPQSIGARVRYPQTQPGHASLPFTLSRSSANPAMLGSVGRTAWLLVTSVRL